MTFSPVLARRLADPDAEAVRRSTADAITELQGLPVVGARVIRNIVMADAASVIVPHGFGKAPSFVGVSTIRGATSGGVVQDFGSVTPAGTPNDMTKTLSLRAIGFGATITVDLLVVP